MFIFRKQHSLHCWKHCTICRSFRCRAQKSITPFALWRHLDGKAASIFENGTVSGVGRKFSNFHCVAHGGHLYLECAVFDVTIWRRIHVSKPTFRRSLL